MVDFLSGKVRKTPPTDVPENRYKFLKLQDAEPDLGVAAGNNYILTSDTAGIRVWRNASDISGFLGSRGYTGSVGFTGSQGPIGFTGSQGPAGGEGSLGYTGSVGFTGSRGFTGSQGAIGYTGSRGDTGFTGSRGISGFTGSQGIQGIQGIQGFTGSQGLQGFTGSQGIQGFTGSQGIQGFTGSQGLRGFTGSVGDTVLIVDDTSTDATYYIAFTNTTSGHISSANIATTKLYFNPSTGSLNATEFNSLSDIAFKNDISNIENSLSIIDSLRPVKFKWKDTNMDSYGLIAQELESILPELVKENDGIKSVSYIPLIALLLDGYKKLAEKVKHIEEKI